jgi:hypothetical protein
MPRTREEALAHLLESNASIQVALAELRRDARG